MILTKRLLIIILLSTFVSCGFKELNNLNIYNSSKNKIEKHGLKLNAKIKKDIHETLEILKEIKNVRF